MPSEMVLERIAEWEAAGLIDSATAERLRGSEAGAPDAVPSAQVPAGGLGRGLSSFFGPSVAVAEMFGYLGAAFVLAAWHSLISTTFDGGTGGRDTIRWIVPAVVAVILAAGLARGSDRMRRAAGVMSAVAVVHIGGAFFFGLPFEASSWNDQVRSVVAAAAALVAAVVARRLIPAVTTQATLIVAFTTLVASGLALASASLFPGPTPVFDPVPGTPFMDPGLALLKVVLTALTWFGAALVLGLLGLREAWGARRRDADGDAAGAAGSGRRATLTRFAAGLTVVLGTASAVTQSNGYGLDRAIWSLEPWAGGAVMLLVSCVLIAIAFRRDAGAYLYPGAIGVIAAFSQLNAQYVAPGSGPGVALLVEGVILLAVGLAADRLRRRIGPRMGPPQVAAIA